MTEPIKEDLQELIGESTLPIEMQLIISCLRAATVTLSVAAQDAAVIVANKGRSNGPGLNATIDIARYSKIFDDLLVE